MEHETSQNLIKVELTVKQLTSILINFDYLDKLAKERGKSLIAIKYSNDIEPFKKALNYTLAEDPRQFSAEECDLLYWANKFVNDPDAAKKIDEFFSYFNSANDTERGDGAIVNFFSNALETWTVLFHIHKLTCNCISLYKGIIFRIVSLCTILLIKLIGFTDIFFLTVP